MHANVIEMLIDSAFPSSFVLDLDVVCAFVCVRIAVNVDSRCESRRDTESNGIDQGRGAGECCFFEAISI